MALWIAGLVGIGLASCVTPSSIIYQTNPLQPLLQGGYTHGQSTIGDLKTLGDFGLGTFENFQGGEMLILGGVVYAVPTPKTSFVVENSQLKTPFAMVTKFHPSHRIKLKQVADYATLQKFLDGYLSPDKNYAILVQGLFHYLKVQCVQPPLQSGLDFEKIGQEKAELHDVPVKLFGFRMGKGASAVNHVGYHFHGRTRKGQGGHVLDMQSSGPIMVQWQEASELVVLNQADIH